jgi:hypothetical protein
MSGFRDQNRRSGAQPHQYIQPEAMLPNDTTSVAVSVGDFARKLFTYRWDCYGRLAFIVGCLGVRLSNHSPGAGQCLILSFRLGRPNIPRKNTSRNFHPTWRECGRLNELFKTIEAFASATAPDVRHAYIVQLECKASFISALDSISIHQLQQKALITSTLRKTMVI